MLTSIADVSLMVGDWDETVALLSPIKSVRSFRG